MQDVVETITCSKCGALEPNPVMRLANGKHWIARKQCRPCFNAQHMDWLQRAKTSTLKKIKANKKTKAKERYEVARKAVFDHYGRACVHCGEADLNVLQMDHIKNDGADYRRKTSKPIVLHLFENGFTDDVQVLCANCNTAKKANGGVLPESRKAPDIDAYDLYILKGI
jgi:hypothetical protein